MADVPLLERLARLPAVPATAAVELIRSMARPQADPVIGSLFGVDEEGDPVVSALVPAVLQHFQDRDGLTCYEALIEGLTGIWNAAVLPPDDLLLRLQALSPTLGFAQEKGDWARQWLADPTAQDALLVQQCVVRVLLALRCLAEVRATELTTQEG